MPRAKKTRQLEEKKSTTKKQTKKNLTIQVYDLDGKEKSSAELPKEIFKVEANPKLLAQYVRVYLANRRQGTASSKTRGEVVGSTRKIYKQKGTGRARHGDIKAPIFVGGGIVGGPKPRDFSLKLNKKQVRKALFYALSLKLKEKEIFGISDHFLKMEIKTKKIADFLNSIGLDKKNILLVLPRSEKNNLFFSARNIKKIRIISVPSLNAYEVLKSNAIIIIEQGLEVLKRHFLHENK